MAVKMCVSVPNELKAQLEQYNRENPCEKINISQVAQAALNDALITRKAAKCGVA